jgi:hypothetical protein
MMASNIKSVIARSEATKQSLNLRLPRSLRSLAMTQKYFFVFLITVTFSFLFVSKSEANNLEITNFEVYRADIVANTITYTADVSWENSWKTVTNHDAVWVFLKYSTNGGSTWSHATMAGNGTNPNGFNSPTGFDITVPQDQRGFFLKRSSLGSGNVAVQNVRFVWNYAQDNLSDEEAMASNTINRVFGIEMVYVPQGSFYAGDGNSASDYRLEQGSADNDPWYIQNENAITTTNAAADGYYYQGAGASGENASGDIFIVPTSFPKGFQSFYMMKYELTERQWVGFFNTLSTAEKTNRDITSATEGGKNSDGVVNRNTIAWDATNPKSDATTTRPNRPVSYISWPDLLSYADWAALRPLTELEYEKAARGADIASLANEFAWGRDTSNDAQGNEITPNSDEDGTEQISDGASNLNRNDLGWSSGDGRAGGAADGQTGPLRVGIFADGNNSRSASGSGYYGNMELSGNLSEMIVTIGKAQGRQFLGTHGDGRLTAVASYEGNATNIDWPGINASDSAYGVTGTAGSGYRGGDFASPSVRLFQVSTRTNAARDPDGEGKLKRYDASFGIFQGGRLVRTAP